MIIIKNGDVNVMKSNFEKLAAIIGRNNQNYLQYLQEIDADKYNKETLERVGFAKWQLAHDYAARLEAFVYDHVRQLTTSDVELFDLVPYIVYMKLSEKTRRIINIIHKEGRYVN